MLPKELNIFFEFTRKKQIRMMTVNYTYL